MPKGLKEISAITGYSISTVSRVLSNKISGKSASAKTILQAAREQGYSKYRHTIPSENRVLDIALVTQHYSEEFYTYLYASFDLACNQKGHSLSIHSLRYTESIKIQLSYLSQNHDGFILFLPALDVPGYISIKENLSDYPIVSIAPAFDIIFDTFTFDSYQGGALAAQILIDEGFEQFGIITGPKNKWEAALRKNGFKDTIENAGFKIKWKDNGDYSFEAGERTFQSIRKKKIKNIGIFSSNDQMAVGFIHAALEYGYKVPGDFAVVGFDNILFSKIFFPKLTTIHTNVDQLAMEALNHLLRGINGEVSVNGLPRKTLIPVELKIRKTHQK